MQISDATIKRWLDQSASLANLGLMHHNVLDTVRVNPGKRPGFKTISLADMLATKAGADLAMKLAVQEDLRDTSRGGLSAVMIAAQNERINVIPQEWLTQENLTSRLPIPTTEERADTPLHYIAVLRQIQHVPDKFLTPANLSLQDKKGTTVIFFLGKSNTYNYLPVFSENFGVGLPAEERQAWLVLLKDFKKMAAGKLTGMGIDHGITAALKNLEKDLSYLDKPGTWQID